MADEIEIINDCVFLTGIQTPEILFQMSLKTSGEQILFTVDEDVYVDWGDGRIVLHKAGAVIGSQVGTEIEVIGYSRVTTLIFGEISQDDFDIYEINIKEAPDLISAANMCGQLRELRTFNYYGLNKIQDFTAAWKGCRKLDNFSNIYMSDATTIESAWEDCYDLVDVPDIYARNVISIKAAWKNCTNIIDFPKINLNNVIDATEAWMGCIDMKTFPAINLSSTEIFNSTWEQCSSLSGLPKLSYGNATTMNFTFAYMFSLKSMAYINTPSCSSFISLFNRNLQLKCIKYINTTGIGSKFDTADMFKYTTALIAPDVDEQILIENGLEWLNPNTCSPDLGESTFSLTLVCDPNASCQFTSVGADVLIDWGNNNYVEYTEGVITGVPLGDNIVKIVCNYEGLTSFTLDTDMAIEAYLFNAVTLTSLDLMFFQQTALVKVELLSSALSSGVSMSSTFAGCTSLVDISDISFENADSLNSTFKGCTNIDISGDIDFYLCRDFTSTFEDCSGVTRIGNLATASGTTFDTMFKNCSSLECLNQINTVSANSATDMFIGCTSLIMPTATEQTAIEVGMSYNGYDMCDATMVIDLSTSGVLSMSFNGATRVVLADGTSTYYSTGTIPAITYGGEITVISMGTLINSMSDNVTDFTTSRINVYGLTGLFESKTVIDTINISNSTVQNYDNFLKDATFTSFTIDDATSAITLKSMFEGADFTSAIGLNTSNGLYFDKMFKDTTTTTCLPRIDTTSGIFSKGILCNETLDCTGDISCEDINYSDMFENSSLTNPDSIDQELIVQGLDWTTTCP